MANEGVNVRLNAAERLTHEWLKDFFGLRDTHGEESQTFKMAEIVAFNVLRNTFGDNLKDIFKLESATKLKEYRALQTIRREQSKANNNLKLYKSGERLPF